VLGVMDGLLKAGVGNAVHAMNLMFGLYECIGLTLKASGC
jgi:N-acetyl-gamma-glutamylphosphate reductase